MMIMSEQRPQFSSSSQAVSKIMEAQSQNNRFSFQQPQSQLQRRRQNSAEFLSGEKADELDVTDKENFPSAADQPASTSPDDKHHVGPVMGIFFKVWSLVKVTKARHNKMRRQDSEDTSQFSYYSGDQLANIAGGSPSPVPAHQRRSTGAMVLQDNHFRRAGSQPIASSSVAINEPTSNRLQVFRPSNQSCSSTSTSGVSSATSASLAVVTSDSKTPTNNSNSAISGFSNIRRQAVAAYNARRSAADVPVSPSKWRSHLSDQLAKPKLAYSASSGNFAAWTSRIRRSATSINQSDASKYRNTTNQQQQVAREPTVDDYEIGEFHVGHSQMVRQQRRHASEPISGDDDDDDSNDIYSTPNDSIQSVPCSAPNVATATATCNSSFQVPTQIAHHQQPTILGQVHPITKSFSTSNFAQLSASRGQHEGGNNINSSQPSVAPANKSRFKLIYEDSNSQATHSQDSSADSSAANRSSSRLNGSRFFISSSSSEDSNSPSSHQNKSIKSNDQCASQRQQQIPKVLGSSTQSSTEQPMKPLERISPPPQPVELQQGVHCHLQPDSGFLPSLMPANFNQQQPQLSSYVGCLAPGNQNQPPTLLSPLSGALPYPTLVPAGTNYPAFLATPLVPTHHMQALATGYKKSPSLFEISHRARRFSTKYPVSKNPLPLGKVSAPVPPVAPPLDGKMEDPLAKDASHEPPLSRIPNSISLHDCKQSDKQSVAKKLSALPADSEYKLAQMLLELGSNPGVKDQSGCTTLMHAVLSDNLPTVKCLVEHGVELNELNDAGMSAIDLICTRAATSERIEMLEFLIDHGADVDIARASDGARLLDRLISEHSLGSDKLAYVECLLQNGAKMGSTTWAAANHKFDIQLRLLKKLCQDGYFLYKKSSIEAAVYRFEYALRRLAALEQQLASTGAGCNGRSPRSASNHNSSWLVHANGLDVGAIRLFARQIKYQTYLGLSRCERKRRFYKRALEFAQLAILVDSSAYEGFYSKAHILKDIGDYDESLLVIDQTSRLVDKSIETLETKLYDLEQQEGEVLIVDRYISGIHSVANGSNQEPSQGFCNFSWTGDNLKQELVNNLDYMGEAKRHINKLRTDIQAEKEASDATGRQQQSSQIVEHLPLAAN